MHREAQQLGRLQPGEDVGQDLTGVVFVGQAVDDRHARIGRELRDLGLLEGADHHDVDHARDHLGAVFDGLAPPIWYMPASKLTRVRVEAFSKIMASVRSASGWYFS
ncbi:unnamed protein product [Victoria cruziana]